MPHYRTEARRIVGTNRLDNPSRTLADFDSLPLIRDLLSYDLKAHRRNLSLYANLTRNTLLAGLNVRTHFHQR